MKPTARSLAEGPEVRSERSWPCSASRLRLRSGRRGSRAAAPFCRPLPLVLKARRLPSLPPAGTPPRPGASGGCDRARGRAGSADPLPTSNACRARTRSTRAVVSDLGYFTRSKSPGFHDLSNHGSSGPYRRSRADQLLPGMVCTQLPSLPAGAAGALLVGLQQAAVPTRVDDEGPELRDGDGRRQRHA